MILYDLINTPSPASPPSPSDLVIIDFCLSLETPIISNTISFAVLSSFKSYVHVSWSPSFNLPFPLNFLTVA